MRYFRQRVDIDFLWGQTEKTIHDEETSDVDLAESVADLKVGRHGMCENHS